MTDWSPSQVEAIERVGAWLDDPFGGLTAEPGVLRLFGPAGTGKSTVAAEVAAMVKGRVRYAAFTGKAAAVLRRKGCYDASTIHKLIYIPRSQCHQRFQELEKQLAAETDEDRRRELARLLAEERENLNRPTWALNSASDLREASLLILDEVSMVGVKHAQDLLSFEVPILALGDPAQLPPVGERGYFTDPRQQPDVLLREIHRQAEGSAVLELATLVREGRGLPRSFEREGSRVVPPGAIKIPEAAEAFDQIICGRNATRRKIISRVREHMGFGDSPVPKDGDRLVCLRNDTETGLINGQQWHVVEDGVEVDSDRLLLYLKGEDGDLIEVIAHAQYFRGEMPRPYEIRDAQCFDFANAVTCHKAQGDQWPRVCVVDESDAFGPDAARWMYTAITRASEEVTVIR